MVKKKSLTPVLHQAIQLCSSKKYPYLPHRGIFYKIPSPLWKFQLNFLDFFKFFGLWDPHSPGISNPFCWGGGGSTDISGSTHSFRYLTPSSFCHLSFASGNNYWANICTWWSGTISPLLSFGKCPTVGKEKWKNAREGWGGGGWVGGWMNSLGIKYWLSHNEGDDPLWAVLILIKVLTVYFVSFLMK